MANPAAPTNYPVIDLSKLPAPQAPQGNSLAGLAQQLAQQQITPQVQGIQAQQAADTARAALQAQQINQAAQGAARFLQPLGNITQADYANALKQNTGLAAGYSGQLRNDAAAQAAQAQATLASIHGNNQHVTSQGDSLANLLYGLTGSVPGHALVTEGLGATAAARALPASVLASGQSSGLGVLGAGQQAANALSPSIIAAQASEPGLAQSALSGLISQQNAQNAANLAQQNYAENVRYHNLTTAERAKYDTASAAARQTSADAALYRAQNPTPRAPHIIAAGNGYFSIDPATGQATQIAGLKPRPSSVRTANGLTPDAALTAAKDFAKIARANGSTAGTGNKYQYVSTGNPKLTPGTAGSQWVPNANYAPHQAVPYWETVQQGINSGLSPSKAMKAVNATPGYDVAGVNGTPYRGAQARNQIVQRAQQSIAAGVSFADAFSHATASGLFPPALLRSILSRQYASAARNAVSVRVPSNLFSAGG